MICVVTPRFLADLQKLQPAEARAVQQALEQAERDPGHRSLRLKPIQRAAKDVYEMRASLDLRMTAVLKDNCLTIFGVGHHDEALNQAIRQGNGPVVQRARDVSGKVSQDPLPTEPVASSISFSPPTPSQQSATSSTELEQWDLLVGEISEEDLSISDVPSERLRSLSKENREWLSRLQQYGSDNEFFADDAALMAFEQRYGADRAFTMLAILPRGSNVSTSSSPTYRVRSPGALRDFIDKRTSALPFNLPASSWNVIERVVTGPVFVRGGPGSGKTLVATYHALDQAQRETLLGKPRVLYLSYTNALVRDASRRIKELCGEIPPNLELNTIDKKARALGNQHGVVYNDAQLLDYAEQAKAHCADAGSVLSLDADFLLDELQKVLEKHAVSSIEGYLALQRQGRGKALQASERQAVWRWREQFLAILQGKRLQTRAMAIKEAVKRAETVDNSERYDVVVVDEVQDLGIVEVQLFVALAKVTRGKPHVMFCGDTGQAIYKTGFRWKDAGLQIGGGNVLTLETCERSTKEIMTFAASLGITESDDEAEAVGMPAREGLKPRIISGFRNRREMYDFAARHLQQAIASHGKDPAKFAIISRYRKRLEEFAKYVTDGPFTFRAVFQDDRDFFGRGSVKLITAHAAKGLEFDSVIVLPADDDCFPSPKHVSGQFAEDKEWLDAERKLLYVACTRARNVLQLLCGTRQSRFLSSAEDHAVLVGAAVATP